MDGLRKWSFFKMQHSTRRTFQGLDEKEAERIKTKTK